MGILRSIGRIMGVAPSAAEINQQLEEMREQMGATIERLIPLTGKELELLSHMQVDTLYKKRFGIRAHGTWTSIYHEPMMCYSFKDYFANGKHVLLMIRTQKREFIYRVKGKKINVYVNTTPWGFLTFDYKFYGGKRNRLVGRIGAKKERFYPIILGDEEVADIQDDKMTSSIHPRVFFFMRDMSFEKETLMLTLSLYFLVNEYLKKQADD